MSHFQFYLQKSNSKHVQESDNTKTPRWSDAGNRYLNLKYMLLPDKVEQCFLHSLHDL